MPKHNDKRSNEVSFITANGCILGENKFFECSVWPFRAMKQNNYTVIAFCVDCSIIVKTEPQKIELLQRKLSCIR